MSNIAAKLGAWGWYLLPGNPILVRVVHGMSRRTRHMWLRFGYLAILMTVVLVVLLSSGTASGSLATLAKGASRTFMFASITQLLLMCFLSPVFTAGAITQEKDAQTFNILISTPLSNAQIVIGSLMSRLYFVIVLLLAGLPIFFAMMIYGGVTTGQIVRSFAITGATAVLTGSLAITVSMIRVGTRRTVFSFFLAIGLYLCVVYAAGQWWSVTRVHEAPVSPQGLQMSWLSAFHPFLALDVALNRVEAPEIGMVQAYGAVGKYYVAYPPAIYVAQTLALSVLLVIVSMFFVRRCTRVGELTWVDRIVSRFRPTATGQRKRKPRPVWSNPVAWREAMTRASGASTGSARAVVIGIGFVGALVLLYAYLAGRSGFDAAETRLFLRAMVTIEFAIVLLIATNTAASALTREKESMTMDLMLVTPLTSRYIIWGKLRGLVSFVVPLILVPVVSLLLFALCDIIRRTAEPAVFIETALEIGVLLIVFSAYACMLGLHFSLKNKKTVRAIILAVGVLLVVNLGAFFFWSAIVAQTSVAGAALASATPFTAIFTLIDPIRLYASPAELAGLTGSTRIAALIGSVLFAFLHALVVYAWYKSMVRNFDMVIRKQSGQ